MEQKNLSSTEFKSGYYHSGIPVLMKVLFCIKIVVRCVVTLFCCQGNGVKVTVEDIKELYNSNKRQMLHGIGGFRSKQFSNLSEFFEHLQPLKKDAYARW